MASSRSVFAVLAAGLLACALVGAKNPAMAADPASMKDLPLAAQATVAGALARADEQFAARPGGPGVVELRNPDHDLTAAVTVRDVTMAHGGLSWRLALRNWGRAGELAAVAPGAVATTGNRVDVARTGLTEWYVNGALGIEQGFTLAAAPSTSDGRPVVLELATSGAARLAVAEDGASLEVLGPDGAAHLRYAGLTALDASGRALPVAMHAVDGVLRIELDDSGARYPVVVDPLVQTAKLLPAKPVDYLQYGHSVAISGDTLVVGSLGETEPSGHDDTGVLHVFSRSGANWSSIREVAILRPPPGVFWVGYSVAIDGDTIVTGCPSTTNLVASGAGAALVYVRPPGGWVDAEPVAVLTASSINVDTAPFDRYFGNSVAIDGDTIVVGADDFNGSYGEAFVYTKPPGGWATTTETARLTAAVPIFGEGLGTSVAVSGDVIVVGAPESSTGSALIYDKPFGGWTSMTETAAIGASDGADGDAFGWSVAIDGDTIAVGAVGRDIAGFENAGQVYVFEKPIGGWLSETETAILQPSVVAGFVSGAQIGVSLAVAGTRIAVGAQSLVREPFENIGAVYLFDEPVGGWAPVGETAVLTASDGGQFFGAAVDIGDDGVVVVATPNADAPPDVVVGEGYVFEELADAVACPTTPSMGCAAAGKGQLKLKYSSAKPGASQLQWKFGAGPELHRVDFGDPVATTSYALCVYDDGVLTIGSPIFGGFGRWALAGTDGFAYANKDKTYAVGGVRKAQLKGGVAGKSAIQIQGKGADVGLMPRSAVPFVLLGATSSIQVQLQQAGGACYETTFLPTDIKTNAWGYLSLSSLETRGTFQAGY